jgi:hypothetical protein
MDLLGLAPVPRGAPDEKGVESHAKILKYSILDMAPRGVVL